MYIDPFAYEPLVAVGLPPPVLPGGINGSTSLHSSSVRSLGYRNSLRSYRARFLLVHIGDPSSNQATTLESQMIHMIQELSGRTLRTHHEPVGASLKDYGSKRKFTKTPEQIGRARRPGPGPYVGRSIALRCAESPCKQAACLGQARHGNFTAPSYAAA